VGKKTRPPLSPQQLGVDKEGLLKEPHEYTELEDNKKGRIEVGVQLTVAVGGGFEGVVKPRTGEPDTCGV